MSPPVTVRYRRSPFSVREKGVRGKGGRVGCTQAILLGETTMRAILSVDGTTTTSPCRVLPAAAACHLEGPILARQKVRPRSPPPPANARWWEWLRGVEVAAWWNRSADFCGNAAGRHNLSQRVECDLVATFGCSRAIASMRRGRRHRKHGTFSRSNQPSRNTRYVICFSAFSTLLRWHPTVPRVPPPPLGCTNYDQARETQCLIITIC
jgi:hypothetical protein